MDKVKNLEAAKAVFAKNSGIKELFFTNDGQAFAKVGPAKTHQRTLGGKYGDMHLVKNGGYVGDAETLQEDTVEMESPTVDEATAVVDAAPAEKKSKKTKDN
jgi:hypothetical protein